jgi:hypothetical protein
MHPAVGSYTPDKTLSRVDLPRPVAANQANAVAILQPQIDVTQGVHTQMPPRIVIHPPRSIGPAQQGVQHPREREEKIGKSTPTPVNSR